MASNLGLFWREFWNNYHTTGAIAPSGRYLARRLVHYVKNGEAAKNGDGRQILEVGPGTGAVTQQLIPCLRADDSLTLVELNDGFVEHLQQRLKSEPLFQAVANRTQIVHKPVQELPDEGRYDVIVSGLPFNNFSPDLIRSILTTFDRLLAPHGTLSFFEYVGMRPLKQIATVGTQRKKLRGISEALGDFLGEREFRKDLVLANITPAWVHHARRGST